MEEAKVRPEAAIVTDIVRIGGSGDDDHLNEFTEILEFNAADMVQSWILDDQTNFGLRIECDLCHTLGIHFGNEDVSLALKVCINSYFLKKYNFLFLKINNCHFFLDSHDRQSIGNNTTIFNNIRHG